MAATLAGAPAVQRMAGAGRALAARAPNRIGLPDGLKESVEAVSGLAMDDVRVHRNSSKPAALQAHAYAQGTDIHLAPGQERHLPHEAWHVVQQKQGRVTATRQLVARTPINDDVGLEHEADVMGARVLRSSILRKVDPDAGVAVRSGRSSAVVQRGGLFSKSAAEPEGAAASVVDPTAATIDALRASFNQNQPDPPPRAQIVGDTQAALASLDGNLTELPALRESADLLVALFADAMLMRIQSIDAGGGKKTKAKRRAVLYRDKQGLLDLRLEIEKTYQAVIRADPTDIDPATLAEKAEAIRRAGEFLDARGAAITAILALAPAAKTGGREPVHEDGVGVTNIDVRAIAVAKAVMQDGFHPEIVVGLPTGGVQIAARIAGALHARTEALPKLMAIRPKFVKPPGAGADITAEEQRHMNSRDMQYFIATQDIGGAEKGDLHILVVDDFSRSGTSLSEAAAQIRVVFARIGRAVTVRTAVSRYAAPQLGDAPDDIDAGNVLNEIDYVAGPHGTGSRTNVRAAGPGGQSLPDWANDSATHLHHGWTNTGEAALDDADAIESI